MERGIDPRWWCFSFRVLNHLLLLQCGRASEFTWDNFARHSVDVETPLRYTSSSSSHSKIKWRGVEKVDQRHKKWSRGSKEKRETKQKKYPNRQVSMDLFIYFRKHTHPHTHKKKTNISLSFVSYAQQKVVCVCVISSPHPLTFIFSPVFLFFLFFLMRENVLFFSQIPVERKTLLFSLSTI